VVSTPDAQPGAAADASDVSSAGGDEAIPAWSGDPLTVDVKDLTDYVGQPPFTSDRIYERTPAGAAQLANMPSKLQTSHNAESAGRHRCSPMMPAQARSSGILDSHVVTVL
jgi:hypothetical protein